MWVSSIVINNIKGFNSSGSINLDKRMNVLIGPNNAGKSTIIKALYQIQDPQSIKGTDLRHGTQNGYIAINFEDIKEPRYKTLLLQESGFGSQVSMEFDGGGMQRQFVTNRYNSRQGIPSIPDKEPNNFIYPFLSKRKVTIYDEVVDRNRAEAIRGDFTFLVSRVDRVSRPHHLDFVEFENAVQEIIGFPLSTMPSGKGHQIGFPVGRTEGISLEGMGEGIPNLVALITDLCGAENKLFLLEEIENDIHPKALKALLNLIVKKSEKNQFVVSTHSNIVTKYLASIANSKLYRVEMVFSSNIPTTTCVEVGEKAEERRDVLEELGYEMTDYDLWKAWLILEESSIERLINDAFIPWYAPKLKGLIRTIAAPGVDGVGAKINRLFLFTHLAPAYKNRVWVLVDNGDRGKKIVASLKEKYKKSGWQERAFNILEKDDFELYYPTIFADTVKKTLAMANGMEKQSAKKELLEQVLSWIEKEPEVAKKEFEHSAAEIIAFLKELEINIFKAKTKLN